MERIKLILLLLVLIVVTVPVFAQESVPAINNAFPQNPQQEKHYTDFTVCTKTFPVGVEKLFYLVLAGANENNFQIKEIQTKSGYIVFETGYRKFLASVIYVSSTKSMLKITPYSGNYDFSPEVVQKMFRYIETYQNVQF